MSGQLYRMAVTATGEVRDKDGTLISSEPITAELVLTEDELQAFMKES